MALKGIKGYLVTLKRGWGSTRNTTSFDTYNVYNNIFPDTF